MKTALAQALEYLAAVKIDGDTAKIEFAQQNVWNCIDAGKDVLADTAIVWTDQWGGKHNMTPNTATETLRKFYDEWPGGLEEIESAQLHAKKAYDKLESLGYTYDSNEWNK